MAHILVVDDEPDLRDVLCDILTRARYDVVAASGAREALELFRAHQPGLVITDLFLPDESGLNLIFELTRNSGVKVIAISGAGSQGELDFLDCAQKFGAWRALSKPLRREQLLSAVADAIHGPATGHSRPSQRVS
jgi:two-component system, NtrC family, phosphoglycerate transport system response regulator PgtA